SADAILAPAVGAAAGLIVGEIIPGRAARAIVLAHRAPLPLAEIRTPAAPIRHALSTLLDALPFSVHALQHRHSTPTVHSLALAHLRGFSSEMKARRAGYLARPALLGSAQQFPCIEGACDRPRLHGRAARPVRRIAVEDLADRAHRLVLERIAHPREHVERRPCVAMDSIHRQTGRSEQPGPNRALVIAAVAFHDAAAIMRMIGGRAGRE